MRLDVKQARLVESIGRLVPILAPLVFVVIALPLFLLLVMPQFSDYLPGGSRDLEATRQIIQSRRQYLEDLRQLKVLHEKYGDGNAALMNRILPGDKSIPDVFAYYERLAKRMRVGLQSIDIVSQDAPAKGLSGVKEMNISLKFSGVDYKKLKELLKMFEDSSRITEVLSFDIQPEGRSAAMMIKTYYMP